MVYNDLMINNTSVSNYYINRSQPGDYSVSYHRALISVRIIVPFFRMASRPLTAAHQLMLTIYIV